MEPVGVFAEGLALALALVLDGELEELALEDELSAAELEDAELELSELDERAQGRATERARMMSARPPPVTP